MKRDPALVSLSHDHHQALFVAQKLRRATAETLGEDRAAFLAYWEEHGRAHFRLEEEVLLPADAAHGDPHHPLVAQRLPSTSSACVWPITSGSRSESCFRSSSARCPPRDWLPWPRRWSRPSVRRT